MTSEIVLLFFIHCIASYLYVKVAKKYNWFEIKESENV